MTLGLCVILAIMESIYVTTGRTIWRDMVRFWGMLFGINFAMGVATDITMDSSSAPTELITRNMLAMCSAHRWRARV